MSDMVSEQTRAYWLQTVLGWAQDRLAPPQFDECRRALDLDHYALARRADLQGANMQLLVALQEKQRLRQALEQIARECSTPASPTEDDSWALVEIVAAIARGALAEERR